MPQLHFSVDDATAEELTARAQLIRQQLGEGWPDGYLDAVLGSCRESPLEEPEELPLRPVEL